MIVAPVNNGPLGTALRCGVEGGGIDSVGIARGGHCALRRSETGIAVEVLEKIIGALSQGSCRFSHQDQANLIHSLYTAFLFNALDL